MYIYDIKILQKLLEDGYYMPKGSSLGGDGMRTLCRYFPVKKVNYNHRTIYFLDDRRGVALKGFVGLLGRVLAYNEFVELAKLFKVPLDAKMRKELGLQVEKAHSDYAEKVRVNRLRRLSLNRSLTEFVGRFFYIRDY